MFLVESINLIKTNKNNQSQLFKRAKIDCLSIKITFPIFSFL